MRKNKKRVNRGLRLVIMFFAEAMDIIKMSVIYDLALLLFSLGFAFDYRKSNNLYSR